MQSRNCYPRFSTFASPSANKSLGQFWECRFFSPLLLLLSPFIAVVFLNYFWSFYYTRVENDGKCILMLFCLFLCSKMQQVAREGEFSCKKILFWHIIAWWWHGLFISVSVRGFVSFHSLDLTSSSWFLVFNKYLLTFWSYPLLTTHPAVVPTARRPGLVNTCSDGHILNIPEDPFKDLC